MNGIPLDHVAVAVHSLRDAVPLYELLTGHPGSPVEMISDQRVNVVFVGPVELLEPTDSHGLLARFLDRRGPGLHHVAFRVPDLRGALQRLEEHDIPIIDREPRPGARGRQVAFLHPRGTGGVLIELVEAQPQR